jgi:ribosomal protein S15P/S13E
LAEEALLQEQVVFHLTEVQELKVHLTEHQEDRKVLVMLQEKEDQEKANTIC